MCWGCKNGIPPLRIGRSDVSLTQWEAPKMFPFKCMFGLSRDNTFLAGGGTPYAWGYTYKAPFNFYAVQTGAIFETKRKRFEYEAHQVRRNIRNMKHGVNMLTFYRRPPPNWGYEC